MLPDRRRLKLAKVGVEGSNPFARSSFFNEINRLEAALGAAFCLQALKPRVL
jgi:hypothetical protein